MDDTEEGVCVMADPTAAASSSHLVAGKDYPADLAQFRAWFATDDACLDFLDWIRWPAGFHCPYCQSRSAGGAVGRYRCKGCDRRISVTAGTVFDKTRTPLTVWFETVWLMVADKSGGFGISLVPGAADLFVSNGVDYACQAQDSHGHLTQPTVDRPGRGR